MKTIAIVVGSILILPFLPFFLLIFAGNIILNVVSNEKIPMFFE